MNNVAKQDELAVTQRDTLIVKNTYSLFEKSLDSTWGFSTTQAVFASAEHGVEPSSMFSEEPRDAYWYRFHPDSSPNIKLPNEVTQTLDTPNRCNQPGGNPGICLPQSANIENFLNRSMNQIWFKLSDNASYKVLDSPVKITIPENSGKLDIVALKLWPAQDRVIYKIATHVIVEGFRSKINSYAISEGYVKTDLSKMIKIGWVIVGIATQLRWEATRPPSPSNKYTYLESTLGFSEISSNVDTFFKENEIEISGQIKDDPKNNFYMSLDPKIEFSIPQSASAGIQPGGGLLIHYTADVSLDEGIKQLNKGPASSFVGDCTSVEQFGKSYQAYQPFVSNAIESPKSSLNSITDSPNALIAAIITQESTWNPKIVSSGGAIGLMQLLPSTAAGECNLDSSKLVDPESNVECGVIVLSKYSQRVEKAVKDAGGDLSDRTNIMKLSLLSYNCGIGCILNAISANGPKYEDVYPHLPTAENKEYAEKVLSHFSNWQNCLGSGKPPIRNMMSSSSVDVNYKKGRQGPIDSIVIRACGDSYENCIQRFQSQAVEGMHYVVSRNGEVSQLVSDSDTAFHSSYYDDRSIGIALESSDPSRSTDWINMKSSLVNLVKYISIKYDIQRVDTSGTSSPSGCCDSSCGINIKGILKYSQICPSDAIEINGLSWTDLLSSIGKLPPKEDPVLALTNTCSSPEDVGKYVCKNEAARKFGLYKCSYNTDYIIQRAALSDLQPLGLEQAIDYPCSRSDCSDCSNKIIQNTVQDIEDYRFTLQHKASTVVSLNDNYCEEIDDTITSTGTPVHYRGDNHLAYDLTLQQGSRVYSAYAGDIIYSTSSQPTYFGQCGGMVMVKTGDTIIAYSNIASIPASMSNIDPAHAVRIAKNIQIGTVANCGGITSSTNSHIEIRLFKATFDIPSQTNSINICGNPTNCYQQTTGDLTSILQSAASGVPRPIPYWCSSIKWDKGGVYHQSIVPLEEKNVIYDEDNNVLKRAPISLKFSLEDWFATLNCQGNDGKRYAWITEKDMTCQGGRLYSCDRNVPGIGSQRVIKDASLGDYKCTTSKTPFEHKTRFCKTTGIPESESDSIFNFCCEHYSANSYWNLLDAFCENDDYCSLGESTSILLGERDCNQNSASYLADCC